MITRAAFKAALMGMCALGLAACSPSGPPSGVLDGSASAPAAVSNERAGATPSSTGGPRTSGGTYRPAPLGDGVRSLSMVPGRAGRVFIFAGVDGACQPLAEPQLSVARAPAKGDISFRQGQTTRIAASAGGTCLGVSAPGTGVYYTARAGTSGADSFSVTARLASGETMTRDFSVQIAE